MMSSPLVIILLFAGSLYIASLWFADYRKAVFGNPSNRALPGATAVQPWVVWMGVGGAVALVAIETAGEISLGVSGEQSDITAIALLTLIAAGIIEELIFRGYLVVQNRGRTWLIASIIGFSLLFALLHYQYYTKLEDAGDSMILTVEIGAKEGWTLLLLFLNAVWFYYLRFCKWNTERSLLPCFAAHISSNVAVFAVKLVQGHVTGLW